MQRLGIARLMLIAGGAAAATGIAQASLPPYTLSRIYATDTIIEGSAITSPFKPGAYGGPGFNSVAISNSGGAYVHVNLFAEPPAPLPPDPIHHNSNQAILFTGLGNTPFLLGGAGYDEFAPIVGTVTVPSTNYMYDSGYATAVNNNGVGAFGLRLTPTSTNLVSPTTGVYFGNSAMPIREGEPVTAAGVAPGTVFGAFGPNRLTRYPDYQVGAAPLTSSVAINDSNVYLYAGTIVESGQSRRAIIKVAVNGVGGVLSQTLVAKEGGPVGAGPATWTSLATTPNTCSINNAGDVIFSGITSAGVSGIYRTSGGGATGAFVALGGGPTPTGETWAPLAGVPVDLNNGGQYAFRGIVQSTGTFPESADAGETFGTTAGFFPPTANITQGGGPLTVISGTLSTDSDVDVYQIKIGDPTLAVQEAFSATTVPNPGSGFAGAAFDTVLHLFAFNFSNNGVTRTAVGRCDDAAPGVIQSTLTTASLQSSTHQAGDTYFLCVSTPRAHAVNRGLGGAPFPELWQSLPGQIAVSGGIAYWVDPSKGQIGRADVATGAILTPLQVGTAPQQLQGFQGPPDPNSRLLDQKIAIYEAGAGSKIIFQQHGYGNGVTLGETFRTCNLDGTGIADFITTPGSLGASAIAVDSVNGKFYWSRTIAGGTANINRCNMDGSNAEIPVVVSDVNQFGESYAIESIAIDTAGTGKICWVQTVYDLAAPFYLPGQFVKRANLDGTSVQTLANNAKARSLAIDTVGRKLYFTSDLLNKVNVIDLTAVTNTLFLNTTAPVGAGFDAASGRVYWSNPYERMIRRSPTPTVSIENWLGIGPDVGEAPSYGPAYLNGLTSFVRSGTAGATPLPYQIKLTGATFGVQGAMICKNSTSVVARVGQALPGTANIASTVGTPGGPIRISDAGNVAWVGATGSGSATLFVNSDNVGTSSTVVSGGTLGVVSNTAGAMDMSSSGEHIVFTTGAGTVDQCIQAAFVPEVGAGACCDSTGGCQPLTSAACAGTGGNFLGVGAACTPDPCPLPGACCTGATCAFSLPSACSGGSTFVGGSICSPSPCTPQTGACCAGTTCSISTQAACTGAFTQFAGIGTTCNAPGNNTAPCCKADYGQSGSVTVQDIFDFLGGYFAQDPKADINASGTVTVQDIFDYLTVYFAGCN